MSSDTTGALLSIRSEVLVFEIRRLYGYALVFS
jgi:hypothetical protein